MTEVNTRFPVSLTKKEVEIILSRLCREEQPARVVSDLTEHLKRRLAQRERELQELKELMEGPDLQVGI